MKILFRVDHIYTVDDHFKKKYIGVFSSPENAENAIASIKDKPGFCEHPTGFKIKKRWYFIIPQLLDKAYWVDGFFSYYYLK